MDKAENKIAQDLSWVDYVDALSNERFSWPAAIKLRRSRNSAQTPDRRLTWKKSGHEKPLAKTPLHKRSS